MSTPPETPASEPTSPPVAPAAPPAETDWKAEARKWEARAKENGQAAKKLDDMTRRLQAFEDRDKTEAQKLTDRATTAEATAASATAKLLRYEIAANKKLPAEWAARLQGATAEELEADADKLLEALGAQQQRNTPSYDGGVRKPAAAPTDMNALIRRAAGLG